MGCGNSSNNLALVRVWTVEEEKDNEDAIQCQKLSSQFVANYIYYGLPVKTKKSGFDPKSPVFVEVDKSMIETHKRNSDTLNQSLSDVYIYIIDFFTFFKILL